MKAKILVADDSTTIQKIVAMSFENEDISVVGVNNGKQAFEKLAEVKPDIVLADTDMPGLTGYQLSQKIKESKEFSSIQVLLLTSDFEEFNESLFKSCKADDRISKPFKSDEIIKKVNELLKRSAGSPDTEEPELLALSAVDIVDDADLPQAILLEEDDIVPAIAFSADSIVDDASAATPPKTPAKTEDEFSFDNMFNDTFETATDIISTPESANKDAKSGESELAPGFDDIATLADMAKEIEGLDWSEATTHATETSLDETAIPAKDDDAGILDAMVKDLENLKWTEPAATPESAEEKKPEPEDAESLEEVTPIDSLDDLDKTFNELKRPMITGQKTETKIESSAKPTIKNVEPEPEDLLEKMAPSAFSRRNELKPDLIKESLSLLSEKNLGKKNGKKEDEAGYPGLLPPIFEPTEGKLNMMLSDQINVILEKSLSSAIKNEFAGLSDVILQSVREIVREVAPHIAREVIKEEIEKIRDLEDL